MVSPMMEEPGRMVKSIIHSFLAPLAVPKPANQTAGTAQLLSRESVDPAGGAGSGSTRSC